MAHRRGAGGRESGYNPPPLMTTSIWEISFANVLDNFQGSFLQSLSLLVS